MHGLAERIVDRIIFFPLKLSFVFEKRGKVGGVLAAGSGEHVSDGKEEGRQEAVGRRCLRQTSYLKGLAQDGREQAW